MLDIARRAPILIVRLPRTDGEDAMLNVLFWNDDVTPMEFVVDILEQMFEKSRDDAIKLMLAIHHNGNAVCGTYPADRARELASAVTALAQRSGFPLSVTLVDPNAP
jgi:ATP-dependent Clp protease adaptor protein ClpS